MKLPFLALGTWASCLGTAIAAQASSSATTATPTSGEPVIIKMIKHEGGDGKHALHASPDGVDLAHCKGGTRHLDSSDEVREGDKIVKRTRIVLCSKDDAKVGDVAARLTEARKRLSEDTALSAETKAKVLASLDQEIARLKVAPAK